MSVLLDCGCSQTVSELGYRVTKVCADHTASVLPQTLGIKV